MNFDKQSKYWHSSISWLTLLARLMAEIRLGSVQTLLCTCPSDSRECWKHKKFQQIIYWSFVLTHGLFIPFFFNFPISWLTDCWNTSWLCADYVMNWAIWQQGMLEKTKSDRLLNNRNIWYRFWSAPISLHQFVTLMAEICLGSVHTMLWTGPSDTRECWNIQKQSWLLSKGHFALWPV